MAELLGTDCIQSTLHYAATKSTGCDIIQWLETPQEIALCIHYTVVDLFNKFRVRSFEQCVDLQTLAVSLLT